MSRFQNKYRIESARLRGWDYTSASWYYVTICTRDRACVFGKVASGEMELSEIGEMARKCWLDITQHSSAPISLDEYVVMPDHIHGIIIIESRGRDDASRRDVACNVSTNAAAPPSRDTGTKMSSISPRPGSLGALVRSFKSAVTRICRANHLQQFEWQERYFDHIIWTESELEHIRRYIIENPGRWELASGAHQDLWM